MSRARQLHAKIYDHGGGAQLSHHPTSYTVKRGAIKIRIKFTVMKVVNDFSSREARLWKFSIQLDLEIAWSIHIILQK